MFLHIWTSRIAVYTVGAERTVFANIPGWLRAWYDQLDGCTHAKNFTTGCAPMNFPFHPTKSAVLTSIFFSHKGYQVFTSTKFKAFIWCFTINANFSVPDLTRANMSLAQATRAFPFPPRCSEFIFPAALTHLNKFNEELIVLIYEMLGLAGLYHIKIVVRMRVGDRRLFQKS